MESSITEAQINKSLKTANRAMVTLAIKSIGATLHKRYARQVLTRLESCGMVTPEARKHILDGFNDLGRELTSLLDELM